MSFWTGGGVVQGYVTPRPGASNLSPILGRQITVQGTLKPLAEGNMTHVLADRILAGQKAVGAAPVRQVSHQEAVTPTDDPTTGPRPTNGDAADDNATTRRPTASRPKCRRTCRAPRSVLCRPKARWKSPTSTRRRPAVAAGHPAQPAMAALHATIVLRRKLRRMLRSQGNLGENRLSALVDARHAASAAGNQRPDARATGHYRRAGHSHPVRRQRHQQQASFGRPASPRACGSTNAKQLESNRSGVLRPSAGSHKVIGPGPTATRSSPDRSSTQALLKTPTSTRAPRRSNASHSRGATKAVSMAPSMSMRSRTCNRPAHASS